MSNRTLLIIGVIALLVLVAGPLLMGFFGPQFGYGMMGYGRGMMGGYGNWMHPGMMGGYYGTGSTGAGWGWMALFGVLGVLGWVAQIAVLAVIVALIIRWLTPKPVNPNPPQA